MDKEDKKRKAQEQVRSARVKEAKRGRRVGSVLHPNCLSCGASRERETGLRHNNKRLQCWCCKQYRHRYSMVPFHESGMINVWAGVSIASEKEKKKKKAIQLKKAFHFTAHRILLSVLHTTGTVPVPDYSSTGRQEEEVFTMVTKTLMGLPYGTCSATGFQAG